METQTTLSISTDAPIGPVMRAIRLAFGMSQSETAAKMHRQQAAVCKLEAKPEGEWQIRDVAAYANALGFDCHVVLRPRPTVINVTEAG